MSDRLFLELENYFEQFGIQLYGVKNGGKKEPLRLYSNVLPITFTMKFSDEKWKEKSKVNLNQKGGLRLALKGFSRRNDFLIIKYQQIGPDEMRGILIPKEYLRLLRKNSADLTIYLMQALSGHYPQYQTVLSDMYLFVQEDTMVDEAIKEVKELQLYATNYSEAIIVDGSVLKSGDWLIDELKKKVKTTQSILDFAEKELPRSINKKRNLATLNQAVSEIEESADVLIRVEQEYDKLDEERGEWLRKW